MCGRYQLAGDFHEFEKEFELEETPGLVPRYNIAPSNGPGFEVPIIIERGLLVPARFWYIPSFWQKPRKELPTSFNARSETAHQKPLFRGARRCLVPTSGWREFPGPAGKKRAVAFERRHLGRPQAEFFSFAGLFTEWYDPEVGALVHTFAIVTGEPSAWVKPIVDRMPLLVPHASYADWLDQNASLEEVVPDVTSHSQAAELFAYECRTYGNSTRVDDPECLRPALVQGSLFD